MNVRKWAFVGAVLAGATAASFVSPPTAMAARSGANLTARLNGKVYKAKRITIAGSYEPTTGELILGSTDIHLNIRAQSVTIKVLTLAGFQQGIESATPKAPVTVGEAGIIYSYGKNLSAGSGIGDAAGWIGGKDDVTVTVTSFHELAKRDKQGHRRARIAGTFTGTLTADADETTPQTLEITKGRFQATIVVGEPAQE